MIFLENKEIIHTGDFLVLVHKILSSLYRLRDGETTKHKICVSEGGIGGGKENRPKSAVFVGNAMTMKY